VRRTQLALLGTGILVAVVGVVAVVRATGSCAAGAERTGRATFYGTASPGGACSFPAPPADHLTTAAGPADYAAAAACGGYLQVSGRRGTVTVKVDNLCPECEPGHLDLSTEAFTRLDDPKAGVTPIRFRPVTDPPLAGGLSFRVKEGSSQWWLALLVDQHGNPLRSVQVSTDGGRSWLALTRADDNYWLAAKGAGPGPFQVRVTDDLGHVAVARGIAVRPGAVQRTTARLYGTTASGRTATGATATSRSTAASLAATPTPTRAGTAGPRHTPTGTAPSSPDVSATAPTLAIIETSVPSDTATSPPESIELQPAGC